MILVMETTNTEPVQSFRTQDAVTHKSFLDISRSKILITPDNLFTRSITHNIPYLNRSHFEYHHTFDHLKNSYLASPHDYFAAVKFEFDNAIEDVTSSSEISYTIVLPYDKLPTGNKIDTGPGECNFNEDDPFHSYSSFSCPPIKYFFHENFLTLQYMIDSALIKVSILDNPCDIRMIYQLNSI